MSMKKDALDYHSRGRPGKIEVVPTKPLLTQRDLALAYTPGVAEPCRAIARDPEAAYDYTAKGNLVAVITNGTAVLGLGNIGPLGGKPVMEGKANLFKRFADIDVFDIELNAPTAEEVIAAVKAMAPTFGGINLEDIASPDCFVIEQRLQAELDIPVFHDDQHGTAIIASAAMLNACAVGSKNLCDLKVVFSGAGAAAIATARLFVSLGVKRENVWLCDAEGLVYVGREVAMFPEKAAFAQPTGPGKLADVLPGADVFVGLSVGGVLTADLVRTMAPFPIIFAMANPDPEITYEEARDARPDAIVATGRSDYPNQVNNVLGFPFVFRGALDCRARAITEEMKVAAVKALAALAREDVPDVVLTAYNLERLSFGPDYLIPKPFDPRVLLWVAPAVAKAAADSGVARKPIADYDAYRQRLERLIERSKEVLRPLMNRARTRKSRVVFPDATHQKVLRAAQIMVDERICTPVLVGDAAKIRARAEEHHVNLRGIEIVEVQDDERFARYASELWKLRQRKGKTQAAVRSWLKNPLIYGLMMVRQGDADGLLGGLAHPYKDTLRPALQVVGPARPGAVISGVYAMLFKERRMFFGDCTVNNLVNAETLAQIALNTARVAETFGDTPRVAMLSYSDFGEIRGDDFVDNVRAAVDLVRKLRPSLVIDGEMHADTAVDPELAATDFPFSQIQGDANVLIFPGLASANISYKLLRELGGATALGPIVVGLARPVNALALGSTVDDIVAMAAITVNQIIDQKKPADEPAGSSRG
jgi:malate dehydrogenase (oxaloacetate-decarboxylating)(NADP+)